MGRRRVAGEGSVFRRASDGKYVAQLSIGPRGSRSYLTKTIGPRKPTRTEERAALDELRAKAGGIDVSNLTTGAYLERWVNDARDIRPTTRHGYRAVVTYHLVPTIGSVPLADLTPLHVEGMLTHLGPKMSPKSLRNVHVVLRRALSQAQRAGLISRNPASREYVDAPKVPDQEPRVLTHAEEARLRAVLDGDPIRAHVLVSLGTGLRQGELLGLAWEDIEGDHLRVRKELTYRDGRYSREDPKTPRSKRSVPLNDEVRQVLAEHRTALKAREFVVTSTGPVFVNTTGRPLSGSWLTHRFYDLCDRAGIERQPWKIMRATFRTRLDEAAVPESVINALMGHTRTYTGRKHYTTTTPEQAVAAVARLNQSPNQSRAVGEALAGVD